MNEAVSLSPIMAIAWLAIGYVCGSIPFGLLLARVGGLGDIRSIGSGNIGATNVLRTGSKKIAFVTLACDMLKGAIPVLLAKHFAGNDAVMLAGFGAFVGHVLPVWLKFKGGKGVATYLGVLFAAAWPLAVMFIVVWLVLAAVFRYSSVSSLGASTAVPVAAILLRHNHLIVLTLVIGAIIYFAHRSNFGRLMRGEESKIKLKSSTASK